MAKGLIEEVGDREKEINKGSAVLKKLTEACLLEAIGSHYVKMHDLVRDMAIRIAREGMRLMAKAAMRLDRLAREWMENVEWVSVMDNNISVLPSHPNSPKLSTLLLQRNPLSPKIVDSFFLHMLHLKVLNLSNTGIQLLPNSISRLCNLHVLLLSFTELEELPSLSSLKELRVLDLSHTSLVNLPNDIEGLVKLRRLDLSYTEKLQMFQSGVIQKLSHLENLSMFKSNWRWSLNTGVSEGAGYRQMASFPRLTYLCLSFEDLTNFIDYVRSKDWQVLRSYHLGIGLLSIFQPISKWTYSVEIQGCNLVSQETMIELPNNIQQLALHTCDDVTVLSNLYETSNLDNLRQCYLFKLQWHGVHHNGR